jgi:phosphatidate cytidylyltransferase
MTAIAQTQLLQVLAGVGGVLLLASAVAGVLRWRHGAGASAPVLANLSARIRSWWAIVAVVGLALWLGPHAVTGLFALVSAGALYEFHSHGGSDRSGRGLQAAAFGLLTLQYALVARGDANWAVVALPIAALLVLPAAALVSQGTRRLHARVAHTLLWVTIGVYGLSHVPALLLLDLPGYAGRNILLVLWIVVVTQSSDVLQYVFGKLFGKRQLAPAVSPSKTVEGLLGGVLCATALGASLWWITPFTFWQAALMSLAITVMGFFGGLVLSAIKRDRGVKDWGNLIEGHGGMLDRLDSVVFAAPIFFHLTRYWFAT